MPMATHVPRHTSDVSGRSRSGCLTCKTRKLKCDERKPSCNQCLKRDLTCSGYQTRFRWSAKHEKLWDGPEKNKDSQGAANWPVSRRSRDAARPQAVPRTRSSAKAGASFPDVSDESQDYRTTSRSGNLGSMRPPRHELAPDDNAQAQIPHSFLERPSSLEKPVSTFAYLDSSPDTLFHPLESDASPPLDNDTPTLFNIIDQLENTVSCELAITPHEPGSPDLPRAAVADNGTVLVDYFLNKLCPLHAMFDVPVNTFRLLVVQYLQTSQLIYSCIISQAAAHLLLADESVLSRAIQYQSRAVNNLNMALGKYGTDQNRSDEQHCGHLEEILFACIVLGLSSPWHNADDLGIPHLLGARKVCMEWLSTLTSKLGYDVPHILASRSKSFLVGSMAWWECHIAFAHDQSLDSVEYLVPFLSSPHQIYLHPYTGANTPIYIMMARLAICVRQRQALKKFVQLFPQLATSETTLSQISQRVKDTERSVLGYTICRPEDIRDKNISPILHQHLSTFGHIWKLACLLELYQSFPEMSFRYWNTSGCFSTTPGTDVSHSPKLTLETRRTVDLPERTLIDNLARTIVGLVEDLPREGSYSCYMTAALIICASAMPGIPASDQTGCTVQENCASDVIEQLDLYLLKLTQRRRSVERGRQVIRRLLHMNADNYGLKPVFSRAEKLVEALWSNLDDGLGNANGGSSVEVPAVHWIEVMAELKLVTMFG